jgi:hypothetical protein
MSGTMLMRRLPDTAWLAAVLVTAPLHAAEPERLGNAEFETLHRMLKPQPGESRWMEIQWYPNVWEARRRAAAEGKPLFLWAGSGGAPAAGC